jgi:DNA-binding PadR family transcriptional regulator
MFAHHGPGRFGRRFGGFGAFGATPDEAWGEWMRFGPFGGGPGRRVDRGDVKYLILGVLEDGPKHGYEIIREIEKRSQVSYAPSPGTVYPTLQMLEDLGQVQSKEVDGKRVYELTAAGRAYLAEHQAEAKQAWSQFQEQPWGGGFPGFGTDEQRQLRGELFELARALFAQGRIFRADATTVNRVRDIIRNARQQVDAAFTSYV